MVIADFQHGCNASPLCIVYFAASWPSFRDQACLHPKDGDKRCLRLAFFHSDDLGLSHGHVRPSFSTPPSFFPLLTDRFRRHYEAL
jgi:hypothetical protein